MVTNVEVSLVEFNQLVLHNISLPLASSSTFLMNIHVTTLAGIRARIFQILTIGIAKLNRSAVF